jgi:hypothetical protein
MNSITYITSSTLSNMTDIDMYLKGVKGSRIERAVAVAVLFKKEISGVFPDRAHDKRKSLTLALRDSVALDGPLD